MGLGKVAEEEKERSVTDIFEHNLTASSHFHTCPRKSGIGSLQDTKHTTTVPADIESTPLTCPSTPRQTPRHTQPGLLTVLPSVADESSSAVSPELVTPATQSWPSRPSESWRVIDRLHRFGLEISLPDRQALGTGKPRLGFHDTDLAGGRTDLLIQSPETASPVSPWKAESDSSSLCCGNDTPLTSPYTSPVKPHHFSPSPLLSGLYIAEVDGAHDEAGSPPALLTSQTEEETSKHPKARKASDPNDIPHSDSDSTGDRSSKPQESVEFKQGHRKVDSTASAVDTEALNEHRISSEGVTPLAQASNAERGQEYPFPTPLISRSPVSPLSVQRHPSALLQYCERNATPRQQRLVAGSLQRADRFITSRASTPTKESFHLRKVHPKQIGRFKSVRNSEALPDPFGPTTSRSARTAERFATIRQLPPNERRPFRMGSSVPDVVSSRRAVSAGAVWSVGGTVVTEGAASITNGRGGRVTSGTSAPHYTSDFLRRQSPSEDELQHGQRLAVAMDIDQTARMLTHSSPLSPRTPESSPRSSFGDTGRRHTFWNNGGWENDVMAPSARRPAAKSKNIPIIPFRVLDAPALRDDYYCSLLAYCEVLQCLAVGLGPHVYLWCDSRGSRTSHIPDSLTAPFSAHVTSLSFSSVEGGSGILAIGRADGRITLWSLYDQDPRFDSDQPAPISCVCFRPNSVRRHSVREPSMIVATEELLVGDEVGNVYYYSVEWPSPDQRDLFGWHGSMTLLARINCHSQQVCGIAWSKDGEFFATSGNDNLLYLFESKRLFTPHGRDGANQQSAVNVRDGNASGNERVAGQGHVMAIIPGQQRHLFTLNAAVKAISFAPWQPSLVAAGGGSNDRCIHFFHALSGATLATIDCHAQVTSLVWSEKRKEIAATFGFAQPEHPYRVAVFAWPSCRRIVGIPWWSEERALHAVAYPGGPMSGGQPGQRNGNHQEGRGARRDVEGRPWYGRRTREEGCLVIATSDASIKFHEIWPEKTYTGRRKKCGIECVLGGSQILEDTVSSDLERSSTIR